MKYSFAIKYLCARFLPLLIDFEYIEEFQFGSFACYLIHYEIFIILRDHYSMTSNNESIFGKRGAPKSVRNFHYCAQNICKIDTVSSVLVTKIQ